VGKRRLYDKKGATEYCATTERHIERLRYERKLAYLKVGGLVRFEEEALDALLAHGSPAHEAGGGPAPGPTGNPPQFALRVVGVFTIGVLVPVTSLG